MPFRKFLFWLHLIAGLTAGLVIALMAFTGLCLSFRPQILAWSDQHVTHVNLPASATRIPLADLLSRVREDWPDRKLSAFTVFADPTRAVTINLGRDGFVYANPYTGDSIEPPSPRLRDFFQLSERLHRWLGAENTDTRKITANITHAACAVFLGLCITGLYLWWPRQRFSRVLWFRNAQGKARDWNWHNVIGLWSSPLLLMITLTGLLMAYKPLADLLYKAPATAVIIRPEGVRPLAPAALIAIAQTAAPSWEQITLRLGPLRREPPAQSSQSSASPVILAIQEAGSLSPIPRQLVVNPFTGEILLDETLADYPLRRALRTLAKPLHTGEAGGLIGAILGAIASLGALTLIYTGLALSWRRFFSKRPQPKTA